MAEAAVGVGFWGSDLCRRATYGTFMDNPGSPNRAGLIIELAGGVDEEGITGNVSVSE